MKECNIKDHVSNTYSEFVCDEVYLRDGNWSFFKVINNWGKSVVVT